MLSDSLKTGYPLDTPVKALGIWLAMISGSDLYAERTPAEVDEKRSSCCGPTSLRASGTT